MRLFNRFNLKFHRLQLVPVAYIWLTVVDYIRTLFVKLGNISKRLAEISKRLWMRLRRRLDGGDENITAIDHILFWLDKKQASWDGKRSAPTVLLYAIVFFFISIVVWASVAELDHVVRGQGRVINPMQTQIIQNLEGGIIERIYVREGDVVPEGSVLVSLDPTQAMSLYGEAQKEERALSIRVERLAAEREDREPVFSYEYLRDEPALIAAERAQYNERREVLRTERLLLEAQISQREEERRQAENELVRAEREFQLASDEFNLIEDLVARQLEARLSLITSDRARNEALAQLNQARVALARSDAVLAEARHRLAQSQSNYMNEVGNQYAESVGRLAEVRERLEGLRDRLNRTQLIAPVNSIVNRINVRTESGVVQPGEPILELTPIDGTVEIDAAIQQKDIGFIHTGQPVSVKLTAYDFARFGDIQGTVIAISPDVQVREDGTEFFQIRIELAQAYLEADGSRYPISPGMAANVDMVIAKRTVMEYLLEPVLKLRDRAFRE
jgi:adhesin transport system membrane fusion protein